MNSEENRLCTFDSWPQNAPVESCSLAQEGFFATGRFLEVECNWCHCRINDWEYGDSIHDRHLSVQPQCPFLVQNNNCENIPLLNSETSDEATSILPIEGQNLEPLHIETNRLATFKNWPNPNILPQSLAKAGFFYLNRSDEVKCAWCKGVIAKWEKNDNAFDEHQRFFPNCPRVQLGPLIEMASDAIRDLGIQKITTPKQPKFSSLDARIRTYGSWPISSIQSPLALAQAGLYYQDINDQVRCFHCNIGLRSWQKEDDPWFEHAKWYPQCQFVHLVKGSSYIQNVEALVRKSNENLSVTPRISVNIDEAMATPQVLQALEIGIDAISVRNVTQIQLIKTGRPFSTVEDLVKAVFAESQEETEEPRQDILYNTTQIRPTDNVSQLCSNFSNRTELESVKRDEESQKNMDTDLSAAFANKTCQQQQPKIELSLEEENRKLKDARLCKVCLDEEVGVVFLPCGHLVTCVQCAPGITQCPMCRKIINGFVRTFLS